MSAEIVLGESRPSQDAASLEDRSPVGFNEPVARGRAKQWERVILAATIAGVPTIFLWGITFDPFNAPKLALLVAGVGMALGLRIVRAGRGESLSTERALLLPACLILVPLLISWLASDHQDWSFLGQYKRFEGLMPYAATVVAGLLIAGAFYRRALLAGWCLVGSGAAVATYTVAQAVGLDPLHIPIDLYVTSSIGHGNFLGGFLAILLPLATSLWLGRVRGYRVAMACTVLLGLGLLLSMSQGGWAAGIAGLAVTVGLMLGDRFSLAPRAGVAMAAVVAAFVLGSVLYSMVAPTGPLVSGTTRARGLWWQAAFSMGLESPLVGHGPNVFALKSAEYRVPLDALSHGNDQADGPHSVPMSMFANAGVPGLLGFIFLADWAYRRGKRFWRSGALVKGTLGGIAAYFVQALVSFDGLLLSFALWALLGILAACTAPAIIRSKRRERRYSRLVPIAAIVAALAVGVTSLAWSGSFLVAEKEALAGVTAFRQGDVESGREHMDTALAIRDEPAYRQELGDQLGRAAMESGPQGRGLLREMEDSFSYLDELPFVLGMLRRAYWLHAWSVHDSRTEEKAIAVLRQAVAIDRYNPVLQAQLAEALIHTGRSDEASRRLRAVLSLMDAYGPFDRYRAQVLAVLAIAEHHSGKATEASSLLREALGRAEGGVGSDAMCHLVTAQLLIESEPSRSDATTLSALCPEVLVDLLPPERRPEAVRTAD